MKKISRKPKGDSLAPFFILGLLGVLATIFISMMVADTYEEAKSARLEAESCNRRLEFVATDKNVNNVCPTQLNVRLLRIERTLGVGNGR